MQKISIFKPFNTIALSLSGGGYRATCFHLGTICYLDSVLYQNKSLLERVSVLSSVSGGTFVAVLYAESLAKGQGVRECFQRLYHFMTRVDVISEAFDILREKKWDFKKNRNLINAVSVVYYRHLTQERFGILWNESRSHLTEICFNSTDFASGINFRFQKTKANLLRVGELLFLFKIK
jgi:predicted acylesterase/phospholipase RssA